MTDYRHEILTEFPRANIDSRLFRQQLEQELFEDWVGGRLDLSEIMVQLRRKELHIHNMVNNKTEYSNNDVHAALVRLLRNCR